MCDSDYYNQLQMPADCSDCGRFFELNDLYGCPECSSSILLCDNCSQSHYVDYHLSADSTQDDW